MILVAPTAFGGLCQHLFHICQWRRLPQCIRTRDKIGVTKDRSELIGAVSMTQRSGVGSVLKQPSRHVHVSCLAQRPIER